MSLLKNKHVITALIVAPILSIISYMAVDYKLKEKPQVAETGKSYPLKAKSNCRYTSGECDLVNASFKAKLTVDQQDAGNTLKLTSEFPLDKVNVGISTVRSDQVVAQAMQADDEELKTWSLPLSQDTDENTLLHIAMTSNGAHYFAETNMAFSNYETIFKKDLER